MLVPLVPGLLVLPVLHLLLAGLDLLVLLLSGPSVLVLVVVDPPTVDAEALGPSCLVALVGLGVPVRVIKAASRWSFGPGRKRLAAPASEPIGAHPRWASRLGMVRSGKLHLPTIELVRVEAGHCRVEKEGKDLKEVQKFSRLYSLKRP